MSDGESSVGDVSGFVPLSRPAIGREEIDEVVRTLESGWLTTGPKVAQFEAEFARYVGAPHALGVSSGTAALHLALTSLGVGEGDEVITTPLTFCSTVGAIIQAGAQPVLADVGSDLNMDPESVRKRITGRTRAIVPVHLGGLPCDMDAIWALAARRGLYVIEDAAHAVGSHYRGAPIGAGHPSGEFQSDAACYSFYATKSLATGEGGMVVTHDPELDRKMRILSQHGIDRSAWNRKDYNQSWYYEVSWNGFKYNLSDIQAAIGIHQLRRQEAFLRARSEVASRYSAAFGNLPTLEVPAEGRDVRHSWHLYILRLDPDRSPPDRDAFIEALRQRGIGAGVHFIPIPLHPVYRMLGSDCPRAISEYPRLVSLPMFADMSDRQVGRVVDAVADILSGA